MERNTGRMDQAGKSSDREASSQDQESLESDARIERMDRVAVLFGEITAATREFLRALARSDLHRDWEDEGFGSCAEWLAWRIGITRGTANEKVRAALALEDLPLISEAMARGDLSFSKVRALTRAATPDNEGELLEFALAGSAANLERLVRGWKTLSRFDEQQQERLRHSRRCFSVFPDEDGMYVVRGRLDPITYEVELIGEGTSLRLSLEVMGYNFGLLSLSYLHRARSYEELGETQSARRYYRQFVDIWKEAEPELQHYADEARKGLERIGG